MISCEEKPKQKLKLVEGSQVQSVCQVVRGGEVRQVVCGGQVSQVQQVEHVVRVLREEAVEAQPAQVDNPGVGGSTARQERRGSLSRAHQLSCQENLFA